MKEKNVPRQLGIRKSSSSKEGKRNAIQDNCKKSPLPTKNNSADVTDKKLHKGAGTKNQPINEITKPLRRTINVGKSLSLELITITHTVLKKDNKAVLTVDSRPKK